MNPRTISASALTTLLLTDPGNGRRQPVQRIGPVVRAAGMDELVRLGVVDSNSAAPQLSSPAPQPATAFGATLSGHPSWRASVGKQGRDTVNAALDELAAAGLIQHTSGGFLRPSHTRLTPAGHQLRSSVIDSWVKGSDDAADTHLQALLERSKLLGRATDDRVKSAPTADVAAPIVKALDRAMLDQRIAVMR